jgi:hypothetical protein
MEQRFEMFGMPTNWMESNPVAPAGIFLIIPKKKNWLESSQVDQEYP